MHVLCSKFQCSLGDFSRNCDCSGDIPFKNRSPFTLHSEILQGLREKIIDGTPLLYSNIYTRCWNYDPEERPDASCVLDNLQSTNQFMKISIPDEIMIEIFSKDEVYVENGTPK